MISLVHGLVRSLSTDRVIVEVGGVGLSISVTNTTSSQLTLGSTVQLFTTLVVREDSLTLFGFLDDESRTTFELLQTVSGIGPKVALATLGALTPDDLSRAIASEDVKTIEKVPGIGRKGAQRLILELKGKLSEFSATQSAKSSHPLWHEQVISALISLGFSAKESDGAVQTLIGSYSEEGVDIAAVEISELLKRALQAGKR